MDERGLTYGGLRRGEVAALNLGDVAPELPQIVHRRAVAAPAGGRDHSVMDRRVFLVAVVGGLGAMPLAARAQPQKVARVGFLGTPPQPVWQAGSKP